MGHLGRPFAFAAKTREDKPEGSAEHRLELIADFLVQLCGQRNGLEQPLNMFVLEDLFATGGVSMNSVADAEGYLADRAGAWSSSKMRVNVKGLTPQHLREAEGFLSSSSAGTAAPAAERQAGKE